MDAPGNVASETNTQSNPQPKTAPKPATIALVDGKHSTGTFLRWCEALITTRAKVGTPENILERIKRTTGLEVGTNTRVSRGFPELQALGESPKPASVWWPSASHRRGRLVDPLLTQEKQVKMDSKKWSGPKVSDSFAEIFIHPSLGMGLAPAAARFEYAVALVQSLLRIARGEPTPNKAGNLQEYGKPYWASATALGFDKTDKKNKYLVTGELRMFLDSILSQVGDLPVGTIDFNTAKSKGANPTFKIACPFDLTPERAAKIKTIRGDKMREAIIRGDVHYGNARLTGSYNIAKALPWCHRAGHAPQALVMLSPGGDVLKPGDDPAKHVETVVTGNVGKDATGKPTTLKTEADSQKQPRVRKPKGEPKVA